MLYIAIICRSGRCRRHKFQHMTVRQAAAEHSGILSAEITQAGKIYARASSQAFLAFTYSKGDREAETTHCRKWRH